MYIFNSCNSPALYPSMIDKGMFPVILQVRIDIDKTRIYFFSVNIQIYQDQSRKQNGNNYIVMEEEAKQIGMVCTQR